MPGTDPATPTLAQARTLLWELIRTLAGSDDAIQQKPWFPPDSDRDSEQRVTWKDRMLSIIEQWVVDASTQEALKSERQAHKDIMDELSRFKGDASDDPNLALRMAKQAIAVVHRWVEAIDLEKWRAHCNQASKAREQEDCDGGHTCASQR